MAEGWTPRVTFVKDDSCLEPEVTKVITATVVIKDGKGGQVCFDISEVNDLATELVSLMQSDAPPIRTIDLSKGTAV